MGDGIFGALGDIGGLVKDVTGAVTNIGQELAIDFPKFVAGKVTGNDAAAEKARRDGVKHYTQGARNARSALNDPAADEWIGKLPYGDKVRGTVTAGIDKITDFFDQEMQRQGIIPGDKTAPNAVSQEKIVQHASGSAIQQRAAPILPGVSHAPGNKLNGAFDEASPKAHKKAGQATGHAAGPRQNAQKKAAPKAKHQ